MSSLKGLGYTNTFGGNCTLTAEELPIEVIVHMQADLRVFAPEAHAIERAHDRMQIVRVDM